MIGVSSATASVEVVGFDAELGELLKGQIARNITPFCVALMVVVAGTHRIFGPVFSGDTFTAETAFFLLIPAVWSRALHN